MGSKGQEQHSDCNGEAGQIRSYPVHTSACESRLVHKCLRKIKLIVIGKTMKNKSKGLSGRLLTELAIRPRKGAPIQKLAGILIDSGAATTVLSRGYAEMLGIRCGRSTDKLEIAGDVRDICYRKVDLHIPDTDCLVENAKIAVITDRKLDLPWMIVGADFLQRAGMVIDYRRNRGTILCDIRGRDSNPKDWETAKRERLPDLQGATPSKKGAKRKQRRT